VAIQPAEILAVLRTLRSVASPMWLSGGVAVDFLAGRWTRPRKDLDLVAFTPHRGQLERELDARGLALAHDEGGPLAGRLLAGPAPTWRSCSSSPRRPRPGCWSFRWATRRMGRLAAIPSSPAILIRAGIGSWTGVRFRVCSAEGEWLNRLVDAELVPGRKPEPKLQYDVQLLQSLIPESRRRELLGAPPTRPGTGQLQP
jgi:Aminoglycoside-2''-adenylyltransferase